MKNTYVNLFLVPLLMLLAMPTTWGNSTTELDNFINYPDCIIPTGLIAIDSENELILNWTDNVEETNLVSYEIQFSTSDNAETTSLTANGNSSSIRLGAIRLDVTYSIQLRKICVDPATQEKYFSDWVSTAFLKEDEDRDGDICDGLIAASAAPYGSGLMVIWEGVEASPTGANYKIQWQSVGSGVWEEVIVANGTEYYISDLKEQESFLVQITFIPGGEFNGVCAPVDLGEFYIEKGAEEEDKDEEPEISLPDFLCGDVFDIPVPTNTTPLAHAAVDDIFLIGGFPIKIRTIQGGSGVFSGTGIIPLPFNSKIVAVSFQNVHVNIFHEIHQGEVHGTPDDPNNYPNIPLNPVSIGGEICQDPPDTPGFDDNGIYQPTGLPYDPNGFDANGQFAHQPPYAGYNPGDPFDPNYDPNGFDADGNYLNTGSPYNPNGCSQLGFDANNQPCNPAGSGPYYWIDNGSNGTPTSGGLILADMIKDDIRDIIIAHLNTMYTDATDSIDFYMNACNYIKQDVHTDIVDLELDPDFIVGENGEYADQGMHQNFKERPQPLNTNIQRDPAQIALEQKHIDLYDCDKNLHTFLYFREIIILHQPNDQVDILEKDLLDLIKTFNDQQQTAYGDSLNLVQWINDRVYEKVYYNWLDEYGEEYGANNNTPSLDIIAPDPLKNKYENYWSSGVATNNPWLDSRPKNHQEAFEDFRFQYLQGFEKINGIHRAFFLEAMSQQRNANAAVVDDQEYLLPIEVTRQIAGRNYTVYLDSILFTTTGAECKAFFILENPESGNRAVFQLENIQFSPVGFTDVDLRLELVNDIEIRLSNAAQLNIIGGDDTYVAVNCDGFAGMGVAAEVEICRKYLIPLHETTLEPLPDPKRVTASFTADMPAWGQFEATLNFKPFALAKNKDIKWLVSNATLDLSDLSNPDNIKFPDNYSSPYLEDGVASPLWRGFYMEELSVQLPNKFSESQPEIGGGVEDVIFDGKGFTGKAFVTPVLSLENGTLGGWAFSIDTLSVSVVSNNLTGGALKGLINVPILKGKNNSSSDISPEDCLRYSATIEPDDVYSFSVAPSGDYDADIWKAGITIEPSSTILIEKQGEDFLAKATLHGSVELDGDLTDNLKVKIPTLTFNNLVLQNQAPHFSPGNWNLPTQIGAEFAGFKVSLNGLEVKPGAVEGEAGMHVTLDVGLVGNPGSPQPSTQPFITATGIFDIKGEMVTVNGRQKWQYKDYKVNSFKLSSGNMPGLKKLEGQLTFFKEPTNPTQGQTNWGTGFRGVLDAKFDLKKFQFQIKVVGQFGSLKNVADPYKYFMVDALTMFPGIELGSSGMKLHGFGGGLSYNMNLVTGNALNGESYNDPQLPGIGVTLSGAQLTPDKSVGLGISGTIVMSASVEESFNFNATLGAVLNNNGGFNKLYFKGTSRFMAPIEPLGQAAFGTGKPGVSAPIAAYVDLVMDFQNDVFDGTFDVYVWVAEGLLRGKQDSYGKFGGCEIHIASKDDWYINMGKPSNRNSLGLVIPGFGDLYTLSSYIDIGTNLEPMPPVPSYVAGLTGAQNIVTAESKRASGKGFAFGASLDINTGDMNFLIFYAKFQAGIGYDVMLQKYDDVFCVNTNNDLGINGWYASGQAWAYFSGDVGIRVKVWGQHKNFKILSIAAGAVMQAKLPNPFYARAYVGGHYSILGGMFKGDCKFKVELGEQCIPDGGIGTTLLPQFAIYDYMTPGDTEEGVSTLSIPTIHFGIELNTIIENGDDEFILELAYAQVLDADGAVVPTTGYFDDYNSAYFLKPLVELNPNSQYTISANVKVTKDGAVLTTEEKQTVFTTGEGQTKIDELNVLATYPINGQHNFHWDEYKKYGVSKGHILLDIGQPHLLLGIPDDRKLMVKIISFSPNVIFQTDEVEVTDYGKKVEFSLPELNPTSFYQLQLIIVDADTEEISQLPFTPVPPNTNQPGDNPLGAPQKDNLGASSLSSQPQGIALVDVEASTLNQQNTPPSPIDVLYKINFRSSEYPTFADKITAYNQQHQLEFTPTNVIKSSVNDFEPFDQFELGGTAKVEPMVSLKWDYLGSNWLNTKAMPLIYSQVPQAFEINIDGADPLAIDYRIKQRPSDGDDLIPYKKIHVSQDPNNAPPLMNSLGQFYNTSNNIYDWSIHFLPIKTAYQDLNELYITAFEDGFMQLAMSCSSCMQNNPALALYPLPVQYFISTQDNYERPSLDDKTEIFNVKAKYKIPGAPNFQGSEAVIPFQAPSN